MLKFLTIPVWLVGKAVHPLMPISHPLKNNLPSLNELVGSEVGLPFGLLLWFQLPYGAWMLYLLVKG